MPALQTSALAPATPRISANVGRAESHVGAFHWLRGLRLDTHRPPV